MVLPLGRKQLLPVPCDWGHSFLQLTPAIPSDMNHRQKYAQLNLYSQVTVVNREVVTREALSYSGDSCTFTQLQDPCRIICRASLKNTL